MPAFRCLLCDATYADGFDCPQCRPAPLSFATFNGRLEDPSPPADPSPGFGRYLVRDELGRGGMGRVLSALDRELQRTVALKLCPLDDLRPELAHRFALEAQVTSQLQHPNIVPLYDSGLSPHGDLFYTMKLVRGRPLSEILKEAATPLPRLLRIFTDVAHAVAFAHAMGVIHRDLKPANVMVGEFGEVLVMDWGLARVLNRADPHAPGRSPAASERLTFFGEVMGTPAYMAPEQARGETDRVDARTDVYALGAILYEILAGHPPIVGQGEEVIRKAAAGELLPLPPRASPELSAVVRRAMALDSAQRYASAAALAADVTAFLDGRTLSALSYTPWRRAAKWAWRRRVPLAAAALILVALAGATGATAWVSSARHRARVERDQRQAFDAAVSRAHAALAAPAPTPEEALAAHLAATSELSRALAIRDDDAARAERLRVGRALFDAALTTADYSLARQAARDLGPLGAPADEVEERRRRADDARNAVLAHRRERLQAMLGEVRAGLSRPGRARGAETLEDFVFEAVGYRDEQTVEVLGEALAPLVEKGRLDGRGASWSDAESDLAKFTCRVLGRLGLGSAVEPLARWMEVVWDPVLAVDCGLALCNTRRPEAEPALMDASIRLDPNSMVWRQIARMMPRIPEPAGDAEPANARAFFGRGLRRHERKDYEGALADYTRAGELDPTFLLFNERGLARFELGDYEGAIAEYSRTLIVDPANAVAHANRGNARARVGDVTGAFEDWDHALSLDSRMGGVYLSRGYFRQSLGDPAGAVIDLTRAVELDPRMAGAFAMRGMALDDLGRLQEAVADFDRAIALDPNLALAFYGRGVARNQLGDAAGALADFDRALELDPRLPYAYNGRGALRMAAGDIDGALADFDRAIEREPNHPEIRKNRGVARLAQGDLAGAIEDFERFLELAPDHPEAELARRAIEDARRRLEGDY